MEKQLAEILQTLIAKAPFNSEIERDETLDKLRELAPDDVAPKPRGANEPPPEPDVDPGPVAEPVPPQEQVPPPMSPEVAGASPEESNAFGGSAAP